MKKVAVVYYSRTGFTGKMAEGIAELTRQQLLNEGGISAFQRFNTLSGLGARFPRPDGTRGMHQSTICQSPRIQRCSLLTYEK